MSDWQTYRPRIKARARQIDEPESFVGSTGRVDAPAGAWILEQVIGDTRYSYVLLDEDFQQQWMGEDESFDDDDADYSVPSGQVLPPQNALVQDNANVASDSAYVNVRPAEGPDYGAQETDRGQLPTSTPDVDADATDTTGEPTGDEETDANDASEMPPVGNTLEERGTTSTRRSR
jgi:hypothetical protein